MRGALVLKFGGTSLASPGRMRRAARRVAAHVRRGRRVVVVASAAGHATDGILAGAARLGARPAVPASHPEGAAGRARELDRALATGEDRSAALLALTLWSLGTPTRSLRGGEAGVRARGGFGGGEVIGVEPGRIRRLLDGGVVPVVSGFQGERSDAETVTLGRGGSDTSAVAIAAALGACCHIVTDVDAVFDRDPGLHPDARPLDALDHAALVELVEGGARVVHPSAARLAAESGVPLRIYHFRAPLAGAGTRVGTAPRPVAVGPGGLP